MGTFTLSRFFTGRRDTLMPFFCGVIRVLDGDAKLYEGPSFFRCEQPECRKLVTSGYIEQAGTCYCGGRRLRDAIKLTPEEEQGLRLGVYPLVKWEEIFVNAEIEREQLPADETDDRHTGL